MILKVCKLETSLLVCNIKNKLMRYVSIFLSIFCVTSQSNHKLLAVNSALPFSLFWFGLLVFVFTA